MHDDPRAPPAGWAACYARKAILKWYGVTWTRSTSFSSASVTTAAGRAKSWGYVGINPARATANSSSRREAERPARSSLGDIFLALLGSTQLQFATPVQEAFAQITVMCRRTRPNFRTTC
eukprot:7042416-Prymnesium_polylepis.1